MHSLSALTSLLRERLFDLYSSYMYPYPHGREKKKKKEYNHSLIFFFSRNMMRFPSPAKRFQRLMPAVLCDTHLHLPRARTTQPVTHEGRRVAAMRGPQVLLGI